MKESETRPQTGTAGESQDWSAGSEGLTVLQAEGTIGLCGLGAELGQALGRVGDAVHASRAGVELPDGVRHVLERDLALALEVEDRLAVHLAALRTDRLDLQRHVPQRLVLLRLDIAGAEEAVLAHDNRVCLLLDGDDRVANLQHPVVHDALDVEAAAGETCESC